MVVNRSRDGRRKDSATAATGAGLVVRDRDSDELAAAQRYAHADVTCRDQVESVCRVAFMTDHLIAPVDLAPQPRDQLESLVLRQRRQNRPVHNFTMPSRPACDHHRGPDRS